MMNILEEEDFIKGLPDSALMEEAQRPTGTLKQFVVMSEIQRRSKMRKEHEAQLAQGPQSTVKDQIIQQGIMSSMPPQMAMAPQMAQRMPNMPPQGIQQAMPTQMMSGGGVVKAFGGMFVPSVDKEQIVKNVLASNPNPTMADFLSAGLDQNDVNKYKYLIDPSLSDQARGLFKKLSYSPEGDPVGGAVESFYDSVADSRTRQALDVSGGRLQDAMGVVADDFSKNLEKEGFASALGQGVRGAFTEGAPALARTAYDVGASGIIDLANTPPVAGTARFLDALFTGSAEDPLTFDVPSSDQIIDRVQRRARKATGTEPVENPNQLVDRLIQEQVDLKGFEEGTFNEGIASVGGPFTDNFLLDSEGNPITFEGEFQPTPNDAANPTQEEASKKKPDATRVDIGDATIPSGADAAAGRLSELQAMIDKQSARGSSAAQGAALVALGTSIMEGKTAQGGAKAAEILSKDAQAQGALQLEGAKLRLADARQGERLQIMRDDLVNKLKITDRQSLMAALNSYGDSITALTNDRTRLMTQEGQALMRRLNQEQSLLRSLLIPDVNLGGAGTPTGGSQAPTKSFLDLPNK
jgi:hypothetical protein